MPQFDTSLFSSLLFWEIISFSLLLFILAKFAFPPILKGLEDRERRIKDSLDQAERNRAEAEERLKEYESKLRAAAREAEGILDQAKERAQRALDDNEQRLMVETERIKGEAKREIEHEREKAVREIRGQTADLVLLVAEQVVGRSLTDADHRRLAEEALEAVARDYKRDA